ncbi:MAG TPA: histidinol-phosphate transaminase [Oceanipulchritudo sp.]|nr:histidinol-phosphate transaminase [Oceanipulchritudo sp.]
MTYSDLIRPQIATLPVYLPGKPIELLAREKGLDLHSIIKLASNENPLGSPAGAVEAVRRAAANMALYPDNSGHALVQALAAKHGFNPGQITLAAGSNEIFYRLCDLFAQPGIEVLVGEYAFISYRISAMLAGASVVSVPMPGLQHDLDAMLEAITPKTRLVFLPNPNNPTGTGLPPSEIARFARALPESVVFCYDEAYAEYEEETLDVQALIREGIKIIGTRTFSKVYGLAGLRIGYGYSHPDLAELLNRVRPPFNTSTVAQAAAIAALQDDEWVEHSRQINSAGRNQLWEGFDRLGVNCSGDRGNFVLFSLEQADAIFKDLQEMGIIVRPLAGYGLPDHLRVTIGSEAQNARFLEALSRILK